MKRNSVGVVIGSRLPLLVRHTALQVSYYCTDGLELVTSPGALRHSCCP